MMSSSLTCSIDLLSITNERFMIKVNCSKGTYIRTLGVDISNDLGYGGHLSMLNRTRVGKYKLENISMLEGKKTITAG